MKIEIDLGKLERGTHEGRVKVTRGGKTFYRKQRVGQKEKPNRPVMPHPDDQKKVVSEIDEDEESDRITEYREKLIETPDGIDKVDEVRNFTGAGFGPINKYCRGTLREEESEGFDEKVDLISDFIKDAPKVQGTVYRGMLFHREWSDDVESMNTFLDKMQVDEEIELKTFTSTSVSESRAMEFAGGAVNEKKLAILLEIKSKNGVYLDGCSIHRRESEVLFDKKTQFKVGKIDDSKLPYLIKISMEEI